MPKSIADITDELFSEKPSGTLYHYTSLAGLQGIIQSRSLRLSDNRYFNDASEVEHTSDLLLGAHNRRLEALWTDEQNRSESDKSIGTPMARSRKCVESRSNFDKSIRAPMEQFINHLRNRLSEYPGVCVGSFTKNGNLLSQWRGYCPLFRGVSIGFDAERLCAEAARQGFLIGKCVYSRQRQDEIADEVVRYLAQCIPDAYFLSKSSRGHVHELLRLSVLLKHFAFEEEDEWRIVESPEPFSTPMPVEYREGKSMLIPSIRFQLPHSDDRQVDVEKVYLGPTQQPKLSLKSLSDYLDQCGASPRQPVEYCGIPLRES